MKKKYWNVTINWSHISFGFSVLCLPVLGSHLGANMTSSHHVSIDFSWRDSFYELPCSDDLESIEDNLSGIFYNFFEFSFFSYLNWGCGSGGGRSQRWRAALSSLVLIVILVLTVLTWLRQCLSGFLVFLIFSLGLLDWGKLVTEMKSSSIISCPQGEMVVLIVLTCLRKGLSGFLLWSYSFFACPHCLFFWRKS